MPKWTIASCFSTQSTVNGKFWICSSWIPHLARSSNSFIHASYSMHLNFIFFVCMHTYFFQIWHFLGRRFDNSMTSPKRRVLLFLLWNLDAQLVLMQQNTDRCDVESGKGRNGVFTLFRQHIFFLTVSGFGRSVVVFWCFYGDSDGETDSTDPWRFSHIFATILKRKQNFTIRDGFLIFL